MPGPAAWPALEAGEKRRASGKMTTKHLNMKTLILTATVICLAVAAAFYLGRESQPRSVPDNASVAAADGPADAPAAASAPESVIVSNPTLDGPAAPGSGGQSGGQSAGRVGGESSPVTKGSATAAPAPLFAQAIASLVSPQTSYMQKQAAWQQLKDAGKLDQAITHLEQQVAANPTSAEYPATLGQACLQKAGTIQDIREQGILGMKADQNFEAALALDPSNWEARFWRATAMSYWPPQLNKTGEVIDNFLELVRLQETQAPQPQFAQTYILLGEQYQKSGQGEYARQVWQRGAQLFPGDAKLQEKLADPVPAVQAQAR